MAVRRVEATRQQVGLALREREDNVRAAFSVPPEHDIEVRGRRVLLVDDVYTTGATVSAVDQGAEEGRRGAVDVLTFARVLPGDFRADEPRPYIGLKTGGLTEPVMVDVTIYTRMMCGYCTAAKRLLDRKGVAYTEHDASFSPELRQEMISRANGRSTFPQIFVGDVMSAAATICMSWSGRAGSTGCSPRQTRTEDMIMGIFKAAAIQMRSGTDPERNAADFEALVREAAGQGATYVQTPEMTGAIVRDKEARALAFTAEEQRRDRRRRGSGLSAELGIFLHVGSTAILRADGKLANRALLFAPDGALVAALRQDPHVRRRSRQWRELARIGRLRAGHARRVVADIGVGEARLRHLLRSALPAAVPRRGAGRRRRAHRARRLHPPDRRGALACAAARPRHRERRLRRSPPRKAACTRTAARPSAIR